MRLTCHHDTACEMHMIPHQVLPIMLPAGHHLYSCPKFVSDDVFPMKKAKIKPVIGSRPISMFSLFFKVSIARLVTCHADRCSRQIEFLLPQMVVGVDYVASELNL